MFVVVIGGLALAITNVANNGVVMILALTLENAYINMNPDISDVSIGMMFSLLTFFSALGYILPSGSGVAAICHGNRDWLDPTEIYKYSLLTCIVIYFVGIFIGAPLAGSLL